MTRTKLYTAIYVVLFVFATAQVLVEQSGGLPYWTAFWVIIALSFVKALMVAWYYQHLKWEPRSVSFTMFVGLLAALALTTAAAYSIL
ncbi:cytochrome C oxidase subunit IV family protein [Halorussus salinisoli]|uniref:cytochrome C oxidase subunit IV family protein n=1 Tax=Halorussus salinisoli TaxID=2558242 RepID=UPI0010C17050|nr:cytochrome C oxidase subunit IV family protein [Halorussus salinisoli]